MSVRTLKPEEYYITEEPYYEPVGDELTVFEAAYRNQLPVLLKGPTGCGKTRFMEHMAWRLQRPLITVSCHDDLTASDLVGRYLVTAGETVWEYVNPHRAGAEDELKSISKAIRAAPAARRFSTAVA